MEKDFFKYFSNAVKNTDRSIVVQIIGTKTPVLIIGMTIALKHCGKNPDAREMLN